jgi:hypothetical protein
MNANLVPIMWIAWGSVAVVTFALYLYRGRLSRDEEGQIFLDSAFDHEKAVQDEIVRRLARIQPVVTFSLVVTLALSLLLIVYYGIDAARSLFG